MKCGMRGADFRQLPRIDATGQKGHDVKLTMDFVEWATEVSMLIGKEDKQVIARKMKVVECKCVEQFCPWEG